MFISEEHIQLDLPQLALHKGFLALEAAVLEVVLP